MVLEIPFDNSEDEEFIDVVYDEDDNIDVENVDENDTHLDAEDADIDVVNTSNAYLTEIDVDDSDSKLCIIETDISFEEPPSNILDKRKSQNLGTDKNSAEARYKPFNKDTKPFTIVNILNHSKVESTAAIATPQKRRASFSPTEISPTPKSPKLKAGIVGTEVTCYCPQCNLKLLTSIHRDRKYCPVCYTSVIYQCNKCQHQGACYKSFLQHLYACYPRETETVHTYYHQPSSDYD